MINKEMRTKMKKDGIKTLCTILTATTMMSMATPAFANDDMEEQGEVAAVQMVDQEQEVQVVGQNDQYNIFDFEDDVDENGGQDVDQNRGQNEDQGVQKYDPNDPNNSFEVDNEDDVDENGGQNGDQGVQKYDPNDPNNSFEVDNEDDENQNGVQNGDQGAQNNPGNIFDFDDDEDEDDDPNADGKNKDSNDFYVPTKEEIQDAKKDAANAKTPWMTPQEWDRMKQGISASGDPVGSQLVKAIRGDYENVQEASRAVALAAFTGINDGIIKNIPWVGGLFHGMLTEVLKSNGQIHDKMDEMVNHIDIVTEELKVLQKEMKEANRQTNLRNTLAETDVFFNDLKDLYDEHNGDFVKFMERAAGGEKLTKTDLAHMSYIYTTDRTMKKDNNQVDGEAYLLAYLKLAKKMINKGGVQVQDEFGGKDNIFGWTDDAWKYGKDHVMEIYGRRNQFLTEIDEMMNEGYSVLATAIMLEGNQLSMAMNMCEQQITKYEEMLKNATDEAEIRELTAKKEEFEDAKNEYAYRLGQAGTDYKKLVARKHKVDLMINEQRAKIENDKENYDQLLKNIDYYGNSFTAREAEITLVNNRGEKVTKKTVVYPIFNEKETVIEYRDANGKIFGTQKVSDIRKIGFDDMKTGQTYTIWGNFDDQKGFHTMVERRVKVTGIHYEKSPLWWLGASKNKFIDVSYVDGNGKEHTTKINEANTGWVKMAKAEGIQNRSSCKVMGEYKPEEIEIQDFVKICGDDSWANEEMLDVIKIGSVGIL